MDEIIIKEKNETPTNTGNKEPKIPVWKGAPINIKVYLPNGYTGFTVLTQDTYKDILLGKNKDTKIGVQIRVVNDAGKSAGVKNVEYKLSEISLRPPRVNLGGPVDPLWKLKRNGVSYTFKDASYIADLLLKAGHSAMVEMAYRVHPTTKTRVKMYIVRTDAPADAPVWGVINAFITEANTQMQAAIKTMPDPAKMKAELKTKREERRQLNRARKAERRAKRAQRGTPSK